MDITEDDIVGQSVERPGMGGADILTVYQVLAARAQATRNLTWQVPALTLVSQAFLIGTSAQIQAQMLVRIVLASTILMIGVVSLFVQFKVGVYTVLDLHMLDKYEHLILGKDHRDYLLHHSKTTRTREQFFLEQLGDQHSEDYANWFWHWRPVRPLRLLPMNPIWGGLQVVVSVVGCSVPLIPIFR